MLKRILFSAIIAFSSQQVFSEVLRPILGKDVISILRTDKTKNWFFKSSGDIENGMVNNGFKKQWGKCLMRLSSDINQNNIIEIIYFNGNAKANEVKFALTNTQFLNYQESDHYDKEWGAKVQIQIFQSSSEKHLKFTNYMLSGMFSGVRRVITVAELKDGNKKAVCRFDTDELKYGN